MRWIYISPHLDDAVLSAGGFIYEQTRAGVSVEIWTIVSGYPPPGELTPFAQILHFQWGTGSAIETVDLRRAEDIKAASIVGAKTIHFDVPDCIYRRGPDGEPLYMEIFVQPDESESHLSYEIAQTISPHLQKDDRVICQLGIGGHIDHILVRRAIERLNRPLWCTADVPYVFRHPEELTSQVAGMEARLHPVTDAGLDAWVEAVLAYESQLSSLFDSPEVAADEIRAYCLEQGGLSLWVKNSPNVS